ncbi:MAG: RNA polymerase sigma factor [Pseudomonadota bacterium]
MDEQNPTLPCDADIIGWVLEGNTGAFEKLLAKYKNYVFSIVNRHVPRDQVEDVSQEVFIRVYQSLRKLKRAESFKTWLSAITLRTCHDFWRKRYRSRETPVSTLSSEQKEWITRAITDASAEDWEKRGKQKEAREVLAWLLGILNPAERMVVDLVYLEGLSSKEAAGLLGWSETNVKVRAFRIRQKLKKCLLRREGEK